MSIIAPNRSENVVEKGRPTTRFASFLEALADGVNLINPDGSVSLDHEDLANIGSNTHEQIDAALASSAVHLANDGVHFADAPADSTEYVRKDNAWVTAAAPETLSFTYNGDGTLAGIDGATTNLDFTYSGGLLNTVDDQTYLKTFGYNASNQLTSITVT